MSGKRDLATMPINDNGRPVYRGWAIHEPLEFDGDWLALWHTRKASRLIRARAKRDLLRLVDQDPHDEDGVRSYPRRTPEEIEAESQAFYAEAEREQEKRYQDELALYEQRVEQAKQVLDRHATQGFDTEQAVRDVMASLGIAPPARPGPSSSHVVTPDA